METTKTTLVEVDNHLLLENESLHITRTPFKDGKPCGKAEKIDVTMHVAKLLGNILKEQSASPQSTGEKKECTTKLEDGAYIIHTDGSFERYYDGQTDIENLEKVGIVYDGHKFALPLDGSYGEQKLLTRSDHPKDDYCQCECEALADWDFVKHTNHLKELGLGFELKEGHYLPTAPVWIAIYQNREIINKLLELRSAKPIDFEDDYWFAQRYYVRYAWYFNGYTGTLGYGGVNGGFQVQAVTLWE